MTLNFCFDIKTVSEANQREHWAVKARRKRDQQIAFRADWRKFKAVVEVPATVTFKRFSNKTMDSDNLAGAFKHVRDALAKELGIDDGSSLITWLYEQEKTPTRENWFMVSINPKT